MIITPIHEYNTCHEPGGTTTGGRFCSDAETAAGVAYFGDKLYAEERGYQPPELTHKVTRADNGMWGGSHSGSTAITGSSSTMMGISGYEDDPADKHSAKIAAKFIAAIAADGPGSEEPLFHGFENTAGTVFKPGDTVRLPLTATAGDVSHAQGYGQRLDAEDQRGEPTVFEFPKGTPMVAYGKWSKSEAKEFGHVWTEAIVAGGFRVTGVREVLNPYGWQFDRAAKDAHKVFTRIVTLEPVEIFDPVKGWVPRG